MWADSVKPNGWKAYVVPVFVFLLLGMLAISLPEVLGNGKGLVQRTYTNELGLRLLVPLLLLKFLAAPGCLSAGVPGGLFTPTLTVGALLGGVLGQVGTMFLPGSDPGVYAIIGSAAVLAAATQGPISSVAFLIELTRHVDALLAPVLLAIVGASLLSQQMEIRSVYSARVRKGMLAARKIVLHGTPLDPLATEEFAVATSAATLNAVQRRLLTIGDPLFVIDNEGCLIDSISGSDVADVKCTIPTETMTAADIAQSTPYVLSNCSQLEAIAALREHCRSTLPVIDTNSGRFLGAIADPG